MRPRLLVRTHYQVDEPAYLRAIIGITSPARSDYPERVSERLVSEIRRTAKDFNVAAAGYAVDLARNAGLLNERMTWTPLGHLVALCRREQKHPQVLLSDEEKVAFLRVFLEADGAAILFLLRKSLVEGCFPYGDLDWNGIAREMFVDVYESYLKLMEQPDERVATRRELDKLRGRGFTGRTGSHKMFAHLQVLARVGILTRETNSKSRRYVLAADRNAIVSTVVDNLPNVESLEVLLRANRWVEPCALLSGLDFRLWDESSGGPEQLTTVLLRLYAGVLESGVSLCPLATVVEAFQIELACQGTVISWEQTMGLLNGLQAKHPKDVRFHVDRRGRPAFVKISPSLLG